VLKAKEGLVPDWFFNGGDEEPTIGELYKRYLEEEIELKPKHSAQTTRRRILNGTVGRFAEIKASQLGIGKLRDSRKEWLKSGKTENSFQTYIRALKTMFSWGVKNGYIARNPLNGYELKKGVKAKEKEALDDDQIKRFILLKDDHREIVDYFILGINTGMRIYELWSLEWSQIDIQKRIAYIPEEKAKTNKARKVPLNNVCMDVINRLYVKKEHCPLCLVASIS
jgi:integrase